ncbi:atrial natriuretic peptide-converting enzyme-like isoform X2 [Ptychodera flava]|uniref:atrial natriuretic peptide-converting enzyme-like isoform X2 n=1 Tax=Ptychodera flava TaxID=63121 RepID=UPI003969F921
MVPLFLAVYSAFHYWLWSVCFTPALLSEFWGIKSFGKERDFGLDMDDRKALVTAEVVATTETQTQTCYDTDVPTPLQTVNVVPTIARDQHTIVGHPSSPQPVADPFGPRISNQPCGQSQQPQNKNPRQQHVRLGVLLGILAFVVTAIVAAVISHNAGHDDSFIHNADVPGSTFTHDQGLHNTFRVTVEMTVNEKYESDFEDTSSPEFKFLASTLERELDRGMLSDSDMYKNYNFSKLVKFRAYDDILTFWIFMTSTMSTTSVKNSLTNFIYDAAVQKSTFGAAQSSTLTVTPDTSISYPDNSANHMITSPTYHNEVCSAGEFVCKSKRCINQTLLCNGYSECFDISDEDWRRCYECVSLDGSTLGQSLPYGSAFFPNSMVSSRQLAEERIRQIDPYLDCHPYARLYSRALYAPPCPDSSGFVQLPCRNFCYSILTACFHVLRELGYLGLNFDCLSLDNGPGCLTQPPSERCHVMEFDCGSTHGYQTSNCISVLKRCNSESDCVGDRDEERCFLDDQSCETHQFRCHDHRKCIPLAWKCDGQNDCPDNSDELSCLTKPVQLSGDNDTGTWLSMKRDGVWKPVCADDWTSFHSQLVCNELGYKNVETTGVIVKSIPTGAMKLTAGATTLGIHSIREVLVNSYESCEAGELVTVSCDKSEVICGVRPALPPKPSSRIVGGEPAALGAWPWIASLQNRSNDNFHFCGATLVGSRWLITAAHCFYETMILANDDPSQIVAALGVRDKSPGADQVTRQQKNIKAFYIHPRYHFQTFENDVAILELQEPVTYNDHVRPACIAPSEMTVRPGTLCEIAGWGHTLEDADEAPADLQEAKIPIVSNSQCEQFLSEVPSILKLHDGMVCAGYSHGGTDTCQGDSGGPLLCANADNGRWFLYGVTSASVGCAREYIPGIFTKVNIYNGWINSIIGNPGT